MTLYLPLAEVAFNGLLLILLSAGVSLMAGLFGIGGGFILTPTLIALGIPPSIAVGSQASQVTTASTVAISDYLRRRQVDLRLGATLVVGGIIGVILGVWLFKVFLESGQSEIVIRSLFAVFLVSIGIFMLYESIGRYSRSRKGIVKRRKMHYHNWTHGLPFKIRYRTSRLYISALLPFTIGVFSGLLTALMGVGGGFIIVPALVYIIGVPTLTAIGTSLMQIIFITVGATILHSWINQTLDVILAATLMVGSIVGAKLGTWIAERVHAQALRAGLAVILILVGLVMAYSFIVKPTNIFSIRLF